MQGVFLLLTLFGLAAAAWTLIAGKLGDPPKVHYFLSLFEFACSRIIGSYAQVQAVKPQSFRSPVLSLFAGIWEAKSRVMPFKATAPDVMPFF